MSSSLETELLESGVVSWLGQHICVECDHYVI